MFDEEDRRKRKSLYAPVERLPSAIQEMVDLHVSKRAEVQQATMADLVGGI